MFILGELFFWIISPLTVSFTIAGLCLVLVRLINSCLQHNGGTMTVQYGAKIGDGDTKVWFSSRAIIKILSLKLLHEHYWVMDDYDHGQFVVHQAEHGKPDTVFQMHPSDLHIENLDGFIFCSVTTVEGNKAYFTKHQIKEAEKAWILYTILSFPLEQDIKWILQSNQIMHCPVTIQDAKVAYKIWGPDITTLKGKTAMHSHCWRCWILSEFPRISGS